MFHCFYSSRVRYYNFFDFLNPSLRLFHRRDLIYPESVNHQSLISSFFKELIKISFSLNFSGKLWEFFSVNVHLINVFRLARERERESAID